MDRTSSTSSLKRSSKKWKLKRHRQVNRNEEYSSDIAGYLEKRGKMLAGWQKRFFEAGEGSLRYFADGSKSSCLAQIDLNMVEIQHTKGSAVFSLSSVDSKMQLRAEDEEQTLLWLRTLEDLQKGKEPVRETQTKAEVKAPSASEGEVESIEAKPIEKDREDDDSSDLSRTGKLFCFNDHSLADWKGKVPKRRASAFNCLKNNLGATGQTTRKFKKYAHKYKTTEELEAAEAKARTSVIEFTWERVQCRATWNAYHTLCARLPPTALTELKREIRGLSGLSSEISYFRRSIGKQRSIRVAGYKAPIPCVLLVCESLLKRQGGFVEADVFTSNTPDIATYCEEQEMVEMALDALDDDTFLQQRWPNRVLAGVIKAWFRYLPQQLLSVISIETLTDSSSSADPRAAKRALVAMPEPEQTIFKWLLHFLDSLVQYQETNEMTRSEAASIFLPLLLNIVYFRIDLHGTDHAVGVGLGSVKKALRFLKAMIQFERKRGVTSESAGDGGKDGDADLAGKIRV